jgi:hypothetical protein
MNAKTQLDTIKFIHSREQPNIMDATTFGENRYNGGFAEDTLI